MKLTLKQIIDKLNSQKLYPEVLTVDQVNLLKNKFGDDWMKELGYNKPFYNSPEFESKE